MLAQVALLTLALLQPRPVERPGATPPDTGQLVRSAIEAERQFLALWRREWMESDTHERPGGARIGAIHCHHDGQPYAPNLIRSARSARSWCPTWGLAERRQPGTPTSDEWRDGTVDSTLDARRRPRIAAARGRLLQLLDSTERLVPTSDFVAGQRVRFRLDAGDADGAEQVARGCRATPSWCAALVGYVHAVRGRLPAADSAFTAARALMSATERCGWDDVGPLLPPADRARYAALPCAARDSVSARVWWVSDPLLIEPGNERRVEHDARRTLIRLRAALSEDERHHWQPLDGGDALIEMVVRYGWPSRSVWGGRHEDATHTGWLAGHGSAGSPPYVTAEYAGARWHVVPPLRTALDPASARGADWQLHPADVSRPGRWWPTEHYARRAGPLVQLAEGQWALFRRRDASLLAVATALDAGVLGVPAGDSVDAALLVSSHPDAVRQIARARRRRAPARQRAPDGGARAIRDRGPAVAGDHAPGRDRGLRPAALPAVRRHRSAARRRRRGDRAHAHDDAAARRAAARPVLGELRGGRRRHGRRRRAAGAARPHPAAAPAGGAVAHGERAGRRGGRALARAAAGPRRRAGDRRPGAGAEPQPGARRLGAAPGALLARRLGGASRPDGGGAGPPRAGHRIATCGAGIARPAHDSSA
jgi:hypothetical protein